MSRASTLARKRCVPCEGGVARLQSPAIRALLRKLGGGWRVERGRGDRGARLSIEYATRDFAQGLAFVVRVGELADREMHHPDVELGWGYVRLRLWTHAIGGLSETDFILAAKIDALARRRGPRKRERA